MDALIDDRAIQDDEEDDESFDEETGEVTKKSNGTNGRFDDSSEEEEDDDDEEAAAEVRTCFAPKDISLNSSFRSQKASSSTRMKKRKKPAENEDEIARNVAAKSVKTKGWTRRISN